MLFMKWVMVVDGVRPVHEKGHQEERLRLQAMRKRLHHDLL